MRWPLRCPVAWASGPSELGRRPSPMSARTGIPTSNTDYYPATKAMAPTPGHSSGEDLRFRTFDSTATALRCFQCHSTGTVALGAGNDILPTEMGVRCESCHGPRAGHAKAGGSCGTIRNPKQLNASQLNVFCGSCHRKSPEAGNEYDWSNSWTCGASLLI